MSQGRREGQTTAADSGETEVGLTSLAKRKGTKKRNQTADGRKGGIVTPARDQSGMNDRLFQHVIEATSPFDALDLLTSVAALQMMPADISRTVRLDVLAHAIATHAVHTDRAQASLDDLRRLCNEEPLASFAITRSEDPPEWHFTEPMAWRGASFVVFPGISDDSVFSFRHLVRALDIPPEFYAQAYTASTASRQSVKESARTGDSVPRVTGSWPSHWTFYRAVRLAA